MLNRRTFVKQGFHFAGAALVGSGALGEIAAQTPKSGSPARREVRVGGKRVKVVDVHAHAVFPEVAEVVKNGPLARAVRGGRALGPDRIQEMDKRGIDVQAVDVNTFWWYSADRDLATKIVDTHNAGLAKWCEMHSDRFVGLTSPALQFPDLAAQQLEHAVKQLGMRGAAIGGHVNGEPLSDAKYDPFWAKAQELDVVVFMHPGGAENAIKEDGLKGRADLGNIIGNPLE